MRGKRTKTLYLASYGLKFSHMTLESLEALESCGEIYSSAFQQDTARDFRTKFPALGKKLKLAASSRQADLDKAVLGAFSAHDRVGVLTFGNPAFINKSLFDLETAAAKKRIEAVYLNAVSSLDALITLFRLNMHLELRVLSAELVDGKTPLSQEANTFFFSAGQLNLPGRQERRALFLRRIAAEYNPLSAAFLASCCEAGRGGDTVLTGRVDALPELLKKATAAHTLFIPAYAWDKKGLSNFRFTKLPPWLR